MNPSNPPKLLENFLKVQASLLSEQGGFEPPAPSERGVGASQFWRDDRAAEGARLEVVCTRKGTEGSNPSLSENSFLKLKMFTRQEET